MIIVAFKVKMYSELILHPSSMLVYTSLYSADVGTTWHDFQGQAERVRCKARGRQRTHCLISKSIAVNAQPAARLHMTQRNSICGINSWQG